MILTQDLVNNSILIVNYILLTSGFGSISMAEEW